MTQGRTKEKDGAKTTKRCNEDKKKDQKAIQTTQKKKSDAT
jgi:hypothetical protein